MKGKWDKLNHLFKQIEIPGKTTLLEEGKVSRTLPLHYRERMFAHMD